MEMSMTGCAIAAAGEDGVVTESTKILSGKPQEIRCGKKLTGADAASRW